MGARYIPITAALIRCLLLVFAATSSFAANSQADKDALRKLATLPPMEFTMNAALYRGQLCWKQDIGSPAKIAQLKKDLAANPADAIRMLQLGQVQSDAGLTNEAAISISDAVVAFRRQTAQRPQDAQLLSRLGEALLEANEPVEAEAVLRRAVTLAPREPECWTQLGLYLDRAAGHAIYPENAPPEFSELSGLLLTKYKPTAGQFERAERLVRESIECHDRAISLTSNNPTAFVCRASALAIGAFNRTVKQQISTSHPDISALAVSPFSPECMPDLRRAAQLETDNPSQLAAVAFIEALAAAAQVTHNGEGSKNYDKIWDMLDAEQTRSIRGILRRLTEITESPAKEKASEAAKFLGILQFTIMRDEPPAVASFRRAVALNPQNEQAWVGLVSVLATTDHYQDMADAAQAQVKAVGSPQSHLCLAKAYQKLNQWDKVLEQTRAAVKAAPDNVAARLALVCAMVHVNDEKVGDEMNNLVNLQAHGDEQVSRDIKVHGLFIAALQLALGDEVEDARTYFRTVLERQPDHEGAKAALSIIESWK